ncbi:hypothetical protein LTR62_004384 [Meristemomyces frigidus]|uniref:Uncharacterized protein n=1 Tax=Meristemomyces frigidus TaxID=1508187 RepID=A0AAN7THL4_9PEZI|nr:hypothetical protein LTR62_004384 [Meristemomyces frigidus]
MPTIPRQAQTEDSTTFDPDKYFDAWGKEEITPPYDNDFRKFIIKTFGLSVRDDYGYMAQNAEVTLLSAQTYIECGGQNGLHGWYRDAEGQLREPPTATDIAAYSDIFRHTTSTSKALTALASNAKKGTVRADIAKHLQANYHPPSAASKLAVNKTKTHMNPYFDLWTWTNQNLEWGGPEAETAKVRISHAVLPVIYHHFGCICPSYESLELIRQVANGRKVLDMGSGNGYWTYMLRRMEPQSKKEKKKMEVLPIDNGMSEWRTVWVGDTVEADGIEWLRQHEGGREAVLLLVYPTVGQDFTSKMLKAYDGTTIISAGTQNTSGFTAFAKETIVDWMAREMPGWERVLQIPLPSFAGKDEALFVFEKKANDKKAVGDGTL